MDVHALILSHTILDTCNPSSRLTADELSWTKDQQLFPESRTVNTLREAEKLLSIDRESINSSLNENSKRHILLANEKQSRHIDRFIKYCTHERGSWIFRRTHKSALLAAVPAATKRAAGPRTLAGPADTGRRARRAAGTAHP